MSDDPTKTFRDFIGAELQKIEDSTLPADDIPDVEEIIRQNCVGTHIKSIYRHYECSYLQQDLREHQITLITPSEKTQLDPLENPVGADEFAEQYAEIKEIMDHFFTSSWTTDPDIDMPKDGESVIIEVCPRELLRSMIHSDNHFGLLSYHVREILYRDEEELRRSLRSETWKDLIESTGRLLVQSVTTLNMDFLDENEIRLVYFDHNNDEYKPSNDFYRHPCNWVNLIKGYNFHPTNNKEWLELVDLLNINLHKTG